jgi:hypothetical protein
MKYPSGRYASLTPYTLDAVERLDRHIEVMNSIAALERGGHAIVIVEKPVEHPPEEKRRAAVAVEFALCCPLIFMCLVGMCNVLLLDIANTSATMQSNYAAAWYVKTAAHGTPPTPSQVQAAVMAQYPNASVNVSGNTLRCSVATNRVPIPFATAAFPSVISSVFSVP